MSQFKPGPRGRLSGDDLDTLVRWGLRSSVEDARPSDQVWERIRANAAMSRRLPARKTVPLARRVMRGLSTTLALGPVSSVASLLRFVATRMEAYDMQWPEADRPRWAFTPGLLWIMLSTEQRIY